MATKLFLLVIFLNFRQGGEERGERGDRERGERRERAEGKIVEGKETVLALTMGLSGKLALR